MEIRRIELVSLVDPPEPGVSAKRKRLEIITPSSCSPHSDDDGEETNLKNAIELSTNRRLPLPTSTSTAGLIMNQQLVLPKYAISSVCGRRRDMEDYVAAHPSFCRLGHEELHYYGVYDGHGCSHVASKCRERLHELVKEELENKVVEAVDHWRETMERSFHLMDREAIQWNKSTVRTTAKCRCELQEPESDTVGSTAVVAIVTAGKIVVANCGDSRAVLCRNGKVIPLSIDHKPDRPDELSRIQAVGGRVIYWDGPRVLGVLSMSRAIGDNYLKPYVCCEPEVTITDRTADDDCLILASDGLWDVVSNETACRVATMCLRGIKPSPAPVGSSSTPCSMENEIGEEKTYMACSDASMLLTKLALARRTADNVSVVVVNLRKETTYKESIDPLINSTTIRTG